MEDRFNSVENYECEVDNDSDDEPEVERYVHVGISE